MESQVSVIIPTYNRAPVLERAIRSVFEQSVESWELWIVDDGSTDETSEVLKKYLSDPRIKLIRTENNGVSSARNRALEKVKTPYICFLDSDDEWMKEKLFQQLSFMEKHPEIPLVHGEEVWIRNNKRVNPMKKHKKSGGDVFFDSLKLCCISPSTVMVRREVFKEFGMFREDFPVCEDYDLWLKISCRYKVGFINENLITKYGGHEDQLSRKFKAMDYWRILSIADLLESKKMNEEKTMASIKELKEKSRILLNGYRKHSNLSHYDQIFQLQQKLL